jgi:hypothetical protein
MMALFAGRHCLRHWTVVRYWTWAVDREGTASSVSGVRREAMRLGFAPNVACELGLHAREAQV